MGSRKIALNNDGADNLNKTFAVLEKPLSELFVGKIDLIKLFKNLFCRKRATKPTAQRRPDYSESLG